MARYGNQVNQQMVDMYNPLNIKFYSDVLDKAQTNLNQGAAMQAKMLEDAYGTKHIDAATHNAQVAQVEQDIAGLTDADFVSPTNVIKGISKAAQKFAPYKQLASKQIEEAKREQELRDRWGSNYIGNTVSNLSLTDSATGKLITPDKVNLIAGNREDLQQALTRDFAGLKDKIESSESGLYPIMGGKFYQNTTTTTRGLTPERWEKEFKNNPQLVQQYMEQMPELSKAIQASGQTPEQYLANEISNISKQWIGGTQQSNTQVGNPDWGKAAPTNPLAGNRYVQELSQEEANKSVAEEFNALREARKNPKEAANQINNSLGNKALQWSGVGALWNPIAKIWNWEGEQLGINAKLPTIDNKKVTPEDVQKKTTERMNNLKVSYAPIYKKLKSSGEYGNDKTGYDYNKLENDLLTNIEQIESIMRQTASLKAEVDPTEVPKFYHSILNKTDNGDILKKINSDGTVADEGESYKELITKGKLLPEYQEASITINPVSGRAEMTNVTTQEKYAVDRNRLDVNVKKALEDSEKAYALHKKELINGSFFTQSKEAQEQDLLDLQEIANNADYLFKLHYK